MVKRSKLLTLTALFFVCFQNSSMADSTDRDTAADEEIGDYEEVDLEKLLDTVSSAAKHDQDLAEAPSSVTLITREQIENSACIDVPCLLRQVPEIDVLFIRPMYSSVGARALTDESANKALLLVDGREVSIEIMGWVLWQGLPIHLDDIERIEVIRGPGSALYGANAHSLVVSITTRKGSASSADVYLGGGEHDRFISNVRIGQLVGDWRWRLSGGAETGGNWRLHGEREQEIGRINVQVDREKGSQQSSLQLSFLSAQGIVDTPFSSGQIKNVYIGDAVLSHRADWFQAKLWFNAISGKIPTEQTIMFNNVMMGQFPADIPFLSTTIDAETQGQWKPFQSNLLIAGGNYRWITLFSDELQSQSLYQHRIGLFLHDEQRLFEKLVLTGGIRFDYNNITPTAFSPRLAAVWQFLDNQYLQLAFGRAFRKPSFFETSLHLRNVVAAPGFEVIKTFFQKNLGNDSLENESITSTELGYRARFFNSRLLLAANAFYNQYRNTINFYLHFVTNSMGVPDLSQSEAHFTNEGREVDSLGGSVSLTYRQKNLRLNANYTIRHSWFASNASEDNDRYEGNKGDRVPWEPAHLFNLSFYLNHDNGLRYGLGLHGASECKWNILVGGVFGQPTQLHLPVRWFMSSFLSWRFSMNAHYGEMGILAFNLLNSPYRDLPAPWDPKNIDAGGERLNRQLMIFLRAGW